jgi:hypothetical protein
VLHTSRRGVNHRIGVPDIGAKDEFPVKTEDGAAIRSLENSADAAHSRAAAMGPKTFRNVILLVGLGLGAFAFWDPLKPSDNEAKEAILSAVLADPGDEVTSVRVQHSFTGRNVYDSSRALLWPTHATIIKAGKELPEHEFYLMKGGHNHWTALLNESNDQHWENVGMFGVNRFGL